jgi:hypothetical protein
MGSDAGIARALRDLAIVALRGGDPSKGFTLAREALLRWRRLGDPWGTAEALEGMAHVAVAQLQPARAARLFGAAEALRERTARFRFEWERGEYEHSITTACTVLGEAAFSAAWKEGREMAMEQVIVLALREDAPAAGQP